MTYGIIDRKNHKYYTYMSEVFQAIENAQLQYNWLITDCICYPQNNDIKKLLGQEYCWLTGDELSAIIEQEDFQWIWGCLCGFSKDITMEEVLKYSLPSAEDYNGYYQNPVSLQHPLSSVEIVPSDSTWTLIISKDKTIIDSYLKRYPKCEKLFFFNQRYTEEYMDRVNKTLYIPLYGKSYVSKKGLFLDDKKAEEIWEAEGFALKGKSKSKWLAYYMGIRAAVFDEWLKEQMTDLQDAVVIQIGCGMDSRVIRVGTENHKWYDMDFSEVIEERKRYYAESAGYQMISGDARDCKWLTAVKENKSAIVVMEGVSMYFTVEEMRKLIDSLCAHFEKVALFVDCYTSFAATMSRHRNPINDVGVTEVYGIDNPEVYQCGGLTFVKEHTMIPQKYIDRLKGLERFLFSKLYAGGFSKKLYRLFEYKKK